MSAALALVRSRLALECFRQGSEAPWCPALEMCPEVGSVEWFWFSHEIAASLLLDGQSVDELTELGA